MNDIFISYAREDYSRVKPIVTALEKYGWKPFIDKSSILPGTKWPDEIDRALSESRCVLVAWSKYSITSDWVREEAEAAKTRNILVPLFLDPIEIPFGFRFFQAADLSDWRNDISHQEFQKLIGVVRHKISENGDQSIFDNQKDRCEVISAMNTVLDVLKKYIPEYANLQANIKDLVLNKVKDENIFHHHPSRVFIVGRTNAGKTTLINLMLDKNVFPTSHELSCTKTIACGSHKNGLIFYDSPGIGDNPKQENITRATLHLDQLQTDVVDHIILIDISEKNNEGPDVFDIVTPDEIAGEISGEINNDVLVLKKKSEKIKIAIKKFRVDDFQAWSKDKFNFIIFVMSSDHSLFWQDAIFLRDLYNKRQDKSIIFKVINIHSAEAKTLQAYRDDPEIKRQIDEANNRIKIDLEDEWLLVNAMHGVGVEKIISAFCEKLPVEVIKQFQKIINIQYSDIIYEKLLSVYFDCVARIASLVGCHKVNYKIHGENLLSYSINSLLVMSSYLFEGSIDNFPKAAIKTLIEKLKHERYTWKEVTSEIMVQEKKWVQVKKSSGVKLVDEAMDFLGVRPYKSKEVEEKVAKEITEDKWYYQHGGITAIEFTIAFGKTLVDLQAYKRKIMDEEFFDKMIANQTILKERKNIKRRLQGIRNCSMEYKSRMASEIYEIIRLEL
ncbi:MAG: TIR domain-containing protein [Chlorobium sp.]